MHRFILLGDDIYTLDTVAERDHAAKHMAEAGVCLLPVYRGGPEHSHPEGCDFGVRVEDGIVAWKWVRP